VDEELTLSTSGAMLAAAYPWCSSLATATTSRGLDTELACSKTQQSELSVILLLRSFEVHVSSGNADGGGGCGWVVSSTFCSAAARRPSRKAWQLFRYEIAIKEEL